MPYPALEDAELRIRRGQTSLTIAAPGVGKSQLLANIAHRSGAPTMYWSADTDADDVRHRALALWTGFTVHEVERYERDPAWAEFLAEKLEYGSHIDWKFDPLITLKLLAEYLLAFASTHGEFPHLAVVDNLSNVVTVQAQEMEQQKEFIAGVQRLARETNTHIAMLAHAKGEYESGTRPIPKSGSLGNLFKLPETGITLCKAGDRLEVYVVKNRSGKDDPSAQHPITLNTDLARATILGFRGQA